MDATQTLTLTEFLLARIAEDETVARNAVIPAHEGAHGPHPELSRWRYADGREIEYDYDTDDDWPITVTQDSEGLSPAVTEDVGPHIARHDPARVLAECEAKRQIAHHCEGIINDWPLRYLALPYADHADYREEWTP